MVNTEILHWTKLRALRFTIYRFSSHSQTLFLHKQGKCDFAVSIRSQFPLQRRQLAALPKAPFPYDDFVHSMERISAFFILYLSKYFISNFDRFEFFALVCDAIEFYPLYHHFFSIFIFFPLILWRMLLGLCIWT